MRKDQIFTENKNYSKILRRHVNPVMIVTSVLFYTFNYGQGSPTFAQTNYNPNPLNINKLFVSPEVAQIMKVDFIPTNLYTGRLDLDLPLFEIQSGDIKVPISLKYNSNGFKVEEEASNVGLGWNLQAGGNLTGMIRDIEDNETTIKSLYSYNMVSGQPVPYPTGSLQIANGNLKRPEDVAIPYDSRYITTDALPDLFFSSGPGLKSKFIFKRENNDIFIEDIENPAIMVTSTGYKSFSEELSQYNGLIWLGINRIFPKIYTNIPYLSNLVDTHFTSNNFSRLKAMATDYEFFTLRNPQGIEYNFNTYDVNVSCAQLINTDIPMADTNAMQRSLIDYILESYKIKKNTWHLDKIKDTKDNTILFEYQKFVNSDVTKYLDFSSYKSENIIIPASPSLADENNRLLFGSYQSSTPEQERSLHLLNAVYNYVRKIKWNGGEVEFKYEHSRLDTNNKFALSEIILKDANGNLVKKYVFNYSYFQSPQTLVTVPAYYTKRLKLESIDLVLRNNEIIHNWYSFTYDESKMLPARNSREVDFLGYYNNNGTDQLSNQSLSSTMPKSYFVGGRYQHSITPFPVTGSQQFAGTVSLEANNNSLSGLLIAYKNPTGAINEFLYEPNDFNFYNQTVMGGGARIKKQIIKDNNSPVKEYTYEYLNEQGSTSGSINNIPKFADMVTTKYPNNKPLFLEYLRSKGNIELTDGSYVGYSRVVKKETGKGYVESKYSSPASFGNVYPVTSILIDIPKNSSFPGDIFTDEDIKRGKLLENKVFDNLNNLLTREVFNYSEKIFFNDVRQFKKVNIISFLVTSSSVSGNVYNFSLPVKESNYLLNSKITENYFTGNKITSVTNYFYDNPKRVSLTKQITINADNSQYKTVYQYAENLRHGNQPQQNIAPYQFLPSMIAKNMLEIPLVTSYYKNDIFNKRFQTIYEKNVDNNLILPKNDVSYFEDLTTTVPGYGFPDAVLPDFSNSTLELSYDKYDNKGNLQQYTTKDGIPTAIIWGYNQTQPIAKVVGATYAEASSLAAGIISTSDTDASAVPGNDESAILTALDNFRKDGTMAAYQITTYTYDPLIGVRSITPPSGIREVYIYDNANRLKEIRESNQTGKLLKEFKYNYKN
jgi:hypothetical protein